MSKCWNYICSVTSIQHKLSTSYYPWSVLEGMAYRIYIYLNHQLYLYLHICPNDSLTQCLLTGGPRHHKDQFRGSGTSLYGSWLQDVLFIITRYLIVLNYVNVFLRSHTIQNCAFIFTIKLCIQNLIIKRRDQVFFQSQVAFWETKTLVGKENP